MRRIPLGTLLTASIVVLVMLVYALTFQVRFSEVAIKVRFGKVAAVVTDPFIYPCWPWPIERIVKYDTRLQTLDLVEGEIKTRDGKNIIVGNFAVWRIEDPELFHIAVTTIPKAEEELRSRIITRRAAVIGNEDLSAFVNLDEDLVNANYDRIENTILRGVQTEDDGTARSLYNGVLADFGIHLEKVALRRISLPEETTQSVFQQMVAERQTVAEGYRAEGRAVADTITGRAQASAAQILSFARRKAEEYSSKGVEASTRILKQIAAEDVEFFEWLRWLDALQVSLQQKSTIFLDNNSALFEPFVAPTGSLKTPQTQAGD